MLILFLLLFVRAFWSFYNMWVERYTSYSRRTIHYICFLPWKLGTLWIKSWFWRIYGEGNGTPLQYSCLENPWTEEPGRLQSMRSLRVGHDWATSLSLFSFMHWRRKWQSTPVFFPGESQGRGSLVGCRLWGRTELDKTGAMQQQQRIPWTEKPCGLQSMGSQRVGHNWVNNTFT